jgi:enoyl-CoA hydratase
VDEVLLRTREDRIAVLTLNRPDQLNALSPELQLALRDAVDALAQDDAVDCVLLRGAGRAFCAGFDIKALGEAKARLPLSFGGALLADLAALPQPVVAAVHGICFTAGLELALACDFILAAEGARFCDSHGKWGMHAAWGLTQRLPRRVGQAAAKEMMFTGRQVGGREAQHLGLAARCLPDLGFEDAAMDCARAIAGRSGTVARWIKDQVTVGSELELGAALARELSHRPAGGDGTAARLAERGWQVRGAAQD